MKKILLTLFAAVLTSAAFAQLSQVVLEVVDTSELSCDVLPADQPEGTTTYRLYAELQDPDDFLSSVFAEDGCYSMHVSTTTSFFNSQFGSVLGSDINEGICGFFADFAFDSWLTIGKDNNSNPDAFVSRAHQDEGDPFEFAFGNEAMGSFYMESGLFFTVNESPAGLPTGPLNRVLLGQFTTDGEISYQLNLQVFDGGDSENGSLIYLGYEETDCSTFISDAIDGRALGLIYPFDGCLDETACNYNPEYLESDPTDCCFGSCGCSLEDASNYDPDAVCGITDNCVYGIEGRIYHDANLNSEFDEGDEYLEGITVELLQSEETAVTDANGFFYFPTNSPGYYHLLVQTTEEYGFTAQISPYPVNSITTFEYELGLTTEPSPCCFNWPSGVVFNDLNQDGIQDMGEEAVPNVEITLMPEDITTTTNEFGEFEFDPVPNTYHTLYPEATVDLPYVTTGYPAQLVSSNSGDMAIGLSDGLPNIDFQVYYNYDQILLCNSESSNQLYIFNSSNVPISGVVDVQLSELYMDMSHPLGFDSIVDGHYYMSFTDIQPGSFGGIDGGNYSFTTPLPDFLGESVFFDTEVTAYYNDQPIGSGDHHYTSIVTCAYDPNDIQVTPRGYSDEHYLLPDTELEYKVRFQNAGNAPAQNVLVQDTIPEFLDLNSLELLSFSHDVEVTIDPVTRVANFYFENIQLPDSNCCEPDSHGDFIYFIQMNNDLPPGTRIENTAYIYFDNNPAVVTNTTWTTIYECTQDLADFSIAQAEICADESIDAQAGVELIEEYSWLIDDELMSEESVLSAPGLTPGVYDLQLTVNNPLCAAESMQSFEVFELPLATFDGANGNLLIADDPNLNTYQWYLDGNPIDGATSSEFTFEETGFYSLEVTNESGCSMLSDELIMTFVSINELNANVLSMYPNPVEEQLFVEFAGTSQRQIQIYSVDGRLVKELNCNSNKCSVDVSDLASGKYELVVLGEQTSKASFVKR